MVSSTKNNLNPRDHIVSDTNLLKGVRNPKSERGLLRKYFVTYIEVKEVSGDTWITKIYNFA